MALILKNKPLPRYQMLGLGILGLVAAGIVYNIAPEGFRWGRGGFTLEQKKSMSETREMQRSYTNFATWQRQAPSEVPFFFYVPSHVTLKATGEKKYQLTDPSNTQFSAISLDVLSYSEFQQQKMSLDKAGEKVFGWTNAYAESVFEYEQTAEGNFVMFVVVVDKHDVMKFTTKGDESVKLAKNISRTVQRTELDKYQEVRVVNYADNYFIKIPISLIEVPEKGVSPFTDSLLNLHLKRKTEAENNMPSFDFVVGVNYSQSEDDNLLMKLDELKEVRISDYQATYVTSINPGGVKGIVYRLKNSPDVNRDLEPSYNAIFENDKVFYRVGFPDSKHPTVFEMNQVFNSFRLLSDQEKMIP